MNRHLIPPPDDKTRTTVCWACFKLIDVKKAMFSCDPIEWRLMEDRCERAAGG